ncbi:MAG: hypothetical protein ACREBC_22390 [Pyrinomonadaceae bacterium]
MSAASENLLKRREGPHLDFFSQVPGLAKEGNDILDSLPGKQTIHEISRNVTNNFFVLISVVRVDRLFPTKPTQYAPR